MKTWKKVALFGLGLAATIVAATGGKRRKSLPKCTTVTFPTLGGLEGASVRGGELHRRYSMESGKDVIAASAEAVRMFSRTDGHQPPLETLECLVQAADYHELKKEALNVARLVYELSGGDAFSRFSNVDFKHYAHGGYPSSWGFTSPSFRPPFFLQDVEAARFTMPNGFIVNLCWNNRMYEMLVTDIAEAMLDSRGEELLDHHALVIKSFFNRKRRLVDLDMAIEHGFSRAVEMGTGIKGYDSSEGKKKDARIILDLDITMHNQSVHNYFRDISRDKDLGESPRVVDLSRALSSASKLKWQGWRTMSKNDILNVLNGLEESYPEAADLKVSPMSLLIRERMPDYLFGQADESRGFGTDKPSFCARYKWAENEV